MLDRKLIVEKPDVVRENCDNRGLDVDVDRFVELEALRKAKQAEVDELNREANQVSKSIGKAADPAQREARMAEGRRLRQQTADVRSQHERIVAELDAIHRTIPNLSHPDVPIGADDAANLELFQGKTPRPEFDFQPLDHVQLAEKLGLVDFEAGARVAGHGFYFLTGDAVLLELALQHYALRLLLADGWDQSRRFAGCRS